MKKATIFAMLLAVVPLAACERIGVGPAGTGPGGDQETRGLDAELIAFEDDGFARYGGGAVSDDPIDPQAVFGRDGSNAPDPVEGDVKYVAVSWHSGCYLATGAKLTREGSNLQVEFDIDRPDEPIDCIRSYEPYAQFAVDSDDVEGVKTIQGQPPLPVPSPA